MSEAQPTQRAMIHQALETLGYNAKPLTIAEWIKSNYGKDVKTSTISVEKTWMKKDYAPKIENGQTATLSRDNCPGGVQIPTPTAWDAALLTDAVKSVKASLEKTLEQLRSARAYHLGQVEEIDSLLVELGFPQQ
jgi:hypothetical protein